MYYFELFQALYESKCRYLLVGGLSLNLHGVPRVTHDVDLIIDTDLENVKCMIKVLMNLQYQPRLPVDPIDISNPDIVKHWIKDKNLIGFNFYHIKENFKMIDIILYHPLHFNDAFKNRVIKKANQIEIYLISIEDLIIMKEFSKRDQDMSDISLLRRVQQIAKEIEKEMQDE